MKPLAVAAFLFCAATGIAFSAERRLAFESNQAVYIANLDATIVRNVTNGIFPSISPDSRSLVFTSMENAAGKIIRRLNILEVSSGASRPLGGIPSENSYCGTWSPDGKWIAFTLHADGLWHLAIIKSDGSGFRFLKKGEPDKATLYSQCWARDGQSVFCHDTTNIYRLSLEGSIVGQWRIDRIVPNGAMSGDGRIDVSPDGHRLLLSVDMDEEYDRKNWDGPVPALWSFDLLTEASVRLTSRNLFAWDGCWLDNANILFVSQGPDDKQAALFRTYGRDLKRLVNNARRPSVSRP